MVHELIIDCDTGIDDSLALLCALRRPDAHVVAVTCGFGNASVEQAVENTLRVIQLAQPGYEVPVAAGAAGPLVGEWLGPVVSVHGANGIGGVELPASAQRPLDESAPELICRLAREQPGCLTLVTLGRFTNLALALELEPALPRLLRRVVSMGGTLRHPGNVTAVAEANVWGDPEAADRVMQAGFDLCLVGLDVTHATRITRSWIEFLQSRCDDGSRAVAAYVSAALEHYLAYHWQSERYLDHCPVHDPLAVLVALDPPLVRTRRLPTRVECVGGLTRGMVVTDGRAHPFDAPLAEHCVWVDGERAAEELLASLLRRAER